MNESISVCDKVNSNWDQALIVNLIYNCMIEAMRLMKK